MSGDRISQIEGSGEGDTGGAAREGLGGGLFSLVNGLTVS